MNNVIQHLATFTFFLLLSTAGLNLIYRRAGKRAAVLAAAVALGIYMVLVVMLAPPTGRDAPLALDIVPAAAMLLAIVWAVRKTLSRSPLVGFLVGVAAGFIAFGAVSFVAFIAWVYLG